MTQSVWGWGEAERMPPREGLQQLGAMVEALFGIRPAGLRDPVAPAGWRLDAPTIGMPPALAPLASAEPTDRARHTRGRSYPDLVRGFSGDFANAPDLVLRPESETDVAEILAWASATDVAVTPFGGGTSVVGGLEVDRLGRTGACVSLDLGALNRVLDVDEHSLLASVQAGTFGPALNGQLYTHGLTFRHFPQSFAYSTVGGWAATRAGGHFATGRTHIDDFVASLTAVTPAGTITTRTLPASGAGPDPNRLLLGSEGTLGVITRATLRVQRPPAFRSRATLRFARMEPAVDACRRLAQSGLWPSNCRLLDPHEAALHQVATDGSAVLLIGFESAVAPTAELMNLALAVVGEYGGALRSRHDEAGERAQVADDADVWKRAFIDAPYLQTFLVPLGLIADTFETACTWQQFPALHAAIGDDLRDAMQRVCGGGHLTCRFTHAYPDGPAPYYTFVAPTRFGSELTMWRELKAAASEALARSGGTITHHHAVGRMHRPWYDAERPALFGDALRAAKRTWDPAGVLNPGVLFDPA